MPVIFQIPFLKAMKSILNQGQLLMHLIIILISYVNGGIYDYLNNKCEKSMISISVTESEIASVVNELSHIKSTDGIGLNMEIIKHVIPNLAQPLLYRH